MYAYTCMHVSMHMYMRAYTYICVCTHIYIYTYSCVYVCMCKYMYVCMPGYWGPAPGGPILPDFLPFRHRKCGPLRGLPGPPPGSSKQLWRHKSDQSGPIEPNTPQDCFKTAQEAPKTPHEDFKMLPKRASGGQKCPIPFGEQSCIAYSLFGSYQRPRRPKRRPRSPRDCSRGPERPKTAQESPKTVQEAPMTAGEGLKRGPRGGTLIGMSSPLPQVDPRDRQQAPKKPPRRPQTCPQDTPKRPKMPQQYL